MAFENLSLTLDRIANVIPNSNNFANRLERVSPNVLKDLIEPYGLTIEKFDYLDFIKKIKPTPKKIFEFEIKKAKLTGIVVNLFQRILNEIKENNLEYIANKMLEKNKNDLKKSLKEAKEIFFSSEELGFYYGFKSQPFKKHILTIKKLFMEDYTKNQGKFPGSVKAPYQKIRNFLDMLIKL